MVAREGSDSSDTHLLDEVGDWVGDEDEADDNPFCKCIVGLLCVLACLAPLSCIIAGFVLDGDNGTVLWMVGIGVPIIACCILCFPVPYEGQALEASGCCGSG